METTLYCSRFNRLRGPYISHHCCVVLAVFAVMSLLFTNAVFTINIFTMAERYALCYDEDGRTEELL